MLEIKLSQGRSAKIDDADAKLIEGHKWYLQGRYAVANLPMQGKKWQPKIAMHRLITGAKPGQIIDHRDGDTLNNQRSNLRLCSSKGNAQNRGLLKGRSFKGVTFHKQTGKWQAQRGRLSGYLGLFTTKEEAIAAYDNAAKAEYGEFAATNEQLAKRGKK